MCEQLIEELTKLHKDHGVEWSFGSGESQGKLYGGIAYPKGSRVWQSQAAWFFDDDLVTVLTMMVKTVKPNIGLVSHEA